ncbi:MAG: hypothetical protein HOG51_09600, partial [Gammaproteobacteria bacterium]|nr:hypothetical protein [Gammaproteobacteria bacterium]
IVFYIEAGHDINVKLEDGSTFSDHVTRHRKSGEYSEILKQSGGQCIAAS